MTNLNPSGYRAELVRMGRELADKLLEEFHVALQAAGAAVHPAFARADFDSGHILGQGGGCYDRALALAPRIRVNGINMGWVATDGEKLMQAETLGHGAGWIAEAEAG